MSVHDQTIGHIVERRRQLVDEVKASIESFVRDTGLQLSDLNVEFVRTDTVATDMPTYVVGRVNTQLALPL